MNFVLPQGALLLAPMRSLTQAPFWRLLSHYGPPDIYVSEFIRVHAQFTINPLWIEEALKSVGSQKLWIQFMGNDPQSLRQNIEVIKRYPHVGIDLNVGCPMPKIYKKQAGGGLLRDLPFLRTLLLDLREACPENHLSIKTRLGFDSTDQFDALLDVLQEAQVDCVTLHARTVQDRYEGPVRYDFIRHAVERCTMPIVANGDIFSLDTMEQVLQITGCHGLMLGRGVLRNPWIFSQWRAKQCHQPLTYPHYRDVFAYLQNLSQSLPASSKLGILKHYVSYLAPVINSTFLTQILHAPTENAFWYTCEQFLLKSSLSDQIFCGEESVLKKLDNCL